MNTVVCPPRRAEEVEGKAETGLLSQPRGLNESFHMPESVSPPGK